MNLEWYVRRLRVMGVKETLHRVKEQADLRWLAAGQRIRDDQAPEYAMQDYRFCEGDEPVLPALQWDREANKESAHQLLEGRWPALGFDWAWGKEGAWHRAPDTGQEWPRPFFAAIPYRAGNPYGDIRVAWEPARLQQLISLALLTEEEDCRSQAMELFERLLLSWLEANPPYRGIHYVSAMECGLRLVAVCHAVDMSRPYLKRKEQVWAAVLSLIDTHASLIIRRLSLYSSAGNHTIAECAGLVYAGELFPEFTGAERWRNVGLALLEREAQRQFLPDGGGIEQAFGYHLFVTDLCQLIALLLKKKGKPSAVLNGVVASAKAFLSVFFNDEGELPNIGDNDGGYALSPYLRISQQAKTNPSLLHTYPDSGYSIIAEHEDTDRLIIFDHGPLGMAPSFGHGHSDCLSVYWRERGEALLIDPGTFTYTGEARWRRHFRGVTAHNTVSVDLEDQAVQQSAFMWSRPVSGRLIDTGEMVGYRVFMACHSGYSHLDVVHYRALIYSPAGHALVWDLLHPVNNGEAERNFSLWWQLAVPQIAAAKTAGGYRVRGTRGQCLHLEVQGGEHHCYSADSATPQGWDSRLYGQKVPTTTLEVRYRGQPSHDFYTFITVGEKAMKVGEKEQLKSIVQQLRTLIG